MKIKNIATSISLTLALLYIIGFVCLFTFFSPLADSTILPQERLDYLLSNKFYLQIWYMVIYVLFGLLLIPLTSIIKNIFNNKLANATAIFGYIWAAFVLASGFIFIIGIEKISTLNISNDSLLSVWLPLSILQDAFGGGIELIGGVWVLLIGINGFRCKKFNTFFNSLSLILGVVGIITVLPFFFILGGVFGMLQIVWFIALSVIFYSNKNEK